MEISHSYEDLGLAYFKTRRGTPRFAEFMISNSGLSRGHPDKPYNILELGVGSGQQTEFVEKELITQGITHYKILAYDKSFQTRIDEEPGQLNILIERIKRGELSERVLPVHHNFDQSPLPVAAESVDLVYMAHVIHHLTNKGQIFDEIARVIRSNGRLFILGVTLEDLKDHPLDEFFPKKYEYEKRRYLTETQLRNMFYSVGFSFEKPFRAGRHSTLPIDRRFLIGIEDTTIDSTLKIMENEDPPAFQEGIKRLQEEVEKAERTGNYRTYVSSGRLRVFWGIKDKH